MLGGLRILDFGLGVGCLRPESDAGHREGLGIGILDLDFGLDSGFWILGRGSAVSGRESDAGRRPRAGRRRGLYVYIYIYIYI